MSDISQRVKRRRMVVVTPDNESIEHSEDLKVVNSNTAVAKYDETVNNGVPTTVIKPVVPYNSTLKRIKHNSKLNELSEEDYVSCLENIIERDYFPDLIKLRYIKAIAEAKLIGNSEAVERLQHGLNRIESGEIDENVIKLDLLNSNERVTVNLGKGGLKLDEFHRIFTSEDNRSFERLMEKDINNKITTHKWIEDSEHKHNLAISDIQKATNLGHKASNIATNKSVARNSLMFYPDNDIPSSDTSVKIYSRNTNLDSDYEKRIEELEVLQNIKTSINNQRSKDDKISDAIAADGLFKHKEEIRDSVYETNLSNRGGYDYVHTPKIVAGRSDPAPIMTWGQVSSIESIPSTPMHEGFKMPNVVSREELANALYKKLKSKASTPIYNTNTPLRCDPKTPLIIQRLIEKNSNNIDLQLRESYSAHKYKSSKSSRSSYKPG